MKNFTVIHILLFLLLLLTYTCVNAQEKGDYVLTTTLDTLYGEVKPLDYGPIPKVQLQTTDKKKEAYSIFEIKEFSFKGEQYFPMKHYDRYTFMKLIVPGYLSLYAYQPENQNDFNGLFLYKMDGTSIEVPNLGFKKNMSKFLDDCGAVGERISSGEFNRNKLEEIIVAYNACITENTLEHREKIVIENNNVRKANPWNTLNDKVNDHQEFDGKETALEMITEILAKVSRGEKVPTFVIDGLKNILSSQENLKEPLETALKTLEN